MWWILIEFFSPSFHSQLWTSLIIMNSIEHCKKKTHTHKSNHWCAPNKKWLVNTDQMASSSKPFTIIFFECYMILFFTIFVTKLCWDWMFLLRYRHKSHLPSFGNSSDNNNCNSDNNFYATNERLQPERNECKKGQTLDVIIERKWKFLKTKWTRERDFLFYYISCHLCGA